MDCKQTHRHTDWLTHKQTDEHRKVKIPHMWRRWGIPQNFFFAFIDELEKQILRKLLKWANKKQNNFNIYNVSFFKKNKNTCRYHYQNFIDMIYSSWDIET